MEHQNKYQTQNNLSHKGIFDLVYFSIKHIANRTNLILKTVVYSFKIILLLTLLLQVINSNAQNNITLKMCHNNADSLFPLVNQKEYLASINQLDIESLQSRYLPSIDLNAKINYQSKVTEISFPATITGFESPVVPNEQYGAAVDIKQVIYDGGIIKNTKNISRLKLDADLQQITIEQYKIKERINQFYILCLIIQENEKIVKLAKESINEQKKVLISSVDNGFVNASELDNLNAELLKLDQQIIELSSRKKQAIEALSKLSCTTISLNDVLEIPKLNNLQNQEVYRPEHLLFAKQAKVIEANKDLSAAQRKPKVFAFGSAGIGYPGLNMFSGQMEPYYIVGAQLNWKVWDWKQSKRNYNKLNIQKQVLFNQQEVFNKNLNIQLSEAKVNIEKLEQLIQKDKKIIELRKKITNRSASQLKNGTITSANYIRDLNAEKQARIALKQRELQLTQAKIELFTISGTELFDN